MSWQDYTITLIMITFCYALIPQIYQGFKTKKGLIALQTSSITSFGMYVISFIYITLELYLSATIGFISAILWSILFVQKLRYKK